MIFVSEASRRAYLEHYPRADRARTRIIYPATRTAIATPSAVAVPGIDGPFLLTVGSIGDRKNQAGCIAAFENSGLAARGMRYVICGGREPGFARVEELARRVPGVIRLPYVSDAELSWLYGNATGFVLASLLEGFGMPVAEAIARNLVPLVSRDSVLHEVAGDGALLADPTDLTSIATGMIALANLTEVERARRLTDLHASIERFDIETIRLAWRQAFDDILR
jgi:glycosyltransferase involved in cell wall biosynthesis